VPFGHAPVDRREPPGVRETVIVGEDENPTASLVRPGVARVRRTTMARPQQLHVERRLERRDEVRRRIIAPVVDNENLEAISREIERLDGR
jgi:hypothetical protein